MRLSLSTNWCNHRFSSGEEIADKALELGFSEIELGFHTTLEQVRGFKTRLDRMPVGSVHAFAPVPISAPQGYPELYQLATRDEEARRIARFHVLKNIAFAADIGADSLVLHAGRVPCCGFFSRLDARRRVRRGEKLVEVFRRELAEFIIPELERRRVTLALENLPYREGFPSEDELASLGGDWVKGWFDLGHYHVRVTRGWVSADYAPEPTHFAGMHVHDSLGGDDHLAPGEGRIDFARFSSFASSVRHVVFEPSRAVDEARLRKGIKLIRKLWHA